MNQEPCATCATELDKEAIDCGSDYCSTCMEADYCDLCHELGAESFEAGGEWHNLCYTCELDTRPCATEQASVQETGPGTIDTTMEVEQ